MGTSGVTAAQVFGLTGAMYAKVLCPRYSSSITPVDGVNAFISLFSDAACTDQLASIRQQPFGLRIKSTRFECATESTNTNTYPPPGFVARMSCDDDCSSECQTVAVPANKCVQQTFLTAPIQRSVRTVCDSAGTRDPNVLNYATSDCSGAPIDGTSIPDNRCIFDGSLTCPSAGSFLFATPSPYPTLPGVSDGYAVRIGGCTSSSCDVGCRLDIGPLNVCLNDNSLTSSGDCIKHFCSAGNSIVSVLYDQPNCVSPKMGAIVATGGPQATCMSERGVARCDNSGAYGALPAFGGAFTYYKNSATCNPAVAQVTLLPVNDCVFINGDMGLTLNCHENAAPSLAQSASCGGAATASITVPSDGACQVDEESGSARLQCNYVVGRNGTTTGRYSAASAQAKVGIVGVVAVIVAAAWSIVQ